MEIVKKNILQLIKEKILVCDGAMGTLLIDQGFEPKIPFEYFNIQNPEVIKAIHKSYVNVGVDIILSNTFGASSLKLGQYGLADKQEEIISQGVALAKESAKDNVFIAGDIGPLGKMIEPLGELKFDKALDIFKEQIKYLDRAGVDILLIETMSDIKEVKAAVMAAKEVSRLPIWVQLTFEESQKTLTGTSPEVAAAILEGLGVDIIGVNCSLGPKELLPIIESFTQATDLFISVQPNAGLPEMKKGKTVYSVEPDEFMGYVEKFVRAGVNIVGGCCGTTPEHIKKLVEHKFELISRPFKPLVTKFASRTKVVTLGENSFPLVVGERINPTARKNLTREIIAGKTALIKENAKEQVENGADLLDLNVGVSEGDEAEFMAAGVKAIESVVDVPVVIDSTNVMALEEGLKVCSGRPLINSVCGKKESMETVLPLAKKYGVPVLVLPVDDQGIPKKAEDRLAVVEKIVAEALKIGIRKQDLIVDGLTLTASTNQEEVKETLYTIELLKKKGLKTILGISNISYGLPNRNNVNSAFLSMALVAGLDMAIINPNVKMLMDALYAASVLTGRDPMSRKFVYRAQSEETEKRGEINEKIEKRERTIEEKLKDGILFGDKENIIEYIDEALKQGLKPIEISLTILVPALEEVGRKFEKKEYFLPQLILAAEAMQQAFYRLKKELSAQKENFSKGKIVIATVEGDVHDIGKNIVISVLESYGFTIYDLGKNVPAKVIIEEAIKNKVDIISLSALMTTTMGRMEETILEVKKRDLKIKTILGGAVVTPSFAQRIGADGYAKDAIEAVNIIKKLLNNE